MINDFQAVFIKTTEDIQLNSIVRDPTFGLGQIINDSGVECFYNVHRSGGSITTPWKRNLYARLINFNIYIIVNKPYKKLCKGLYYYIQDNVKDWHVGLYNGESFKFIDNKENFVSSGITPERCKLIIESTDKSLHIKVPNNESITYYIDQFNTLIE